MHLHTVKDRLRLHVAGADVEIRGPRSVLQVVDRMLGAVSRSSAGEEPALAIDVRFDSDVWRVAGTAPRSKKSFGDAKALPQVAGAVVSALVAELAYHCKLSAWRGAALARDGHALALVGDDWESIVTLLAHLHVRGWSLLGSDHILVDRETFSVTPFEKLLHANSFCVVSFPQRYRAAIDASPWYATSNSIEYHAIDPSLVEGAPGWGERTPLRAAVRVDGHAGEYPSLEIVEDFRVAEGLRRSDLVAAGIESGILVRNGFVETCDFLERWFAAAH